MRITKMKNNRAICRIKNGRMDELLDVLHKSFEDVAKEISLTKNGSPLNNAFIEKSELEEQIKKGLTIFGSIENERIIGCIGIMPSSIKNEYYLEKLCVLPEKRHNGIGFELLRHSENEIRNSAGKSILISIINRNKRLKKWSIRNGFSELELSSFKDLPFEVCIMKKDL
jgi:diamine N-acetyltransferase